MDVIEEMEDVMIQPSATASRSRGLILGCSLLLLSNCAYIPKGEYRGGLFLHTAPNYSFQVPDGWRRATVSDYPSFGFNQRLLQTFNETGRRAFMELAEREVRLYEALLISSRGAWIHVEPAVNSDVRYPSGYNLNDQEKQSIWQRVSAELVRQAMPPDKPQLTLESMELVDYGPNTVLKLRFRSDVIRGLMYWTVLGFYSSSHVVAIWHVGIPEDRNEGAAGLEAIGRSFRFE